MGLPDDWKTLIKDGRLYLHHRFIGNEDAKVLAAYPAITTLFLPGNLITDEGAQALAANATITKLYLGGNSIGNAGAKALASNTNITKLNLTGNLIGAEGARAFSANNTITTLVIPNNPFGDEGLIALHEWRARRHTEGNPVEIKGIDLSNERISQAKSAVASRLLEQSGIKTKPAGRTPG